MSPEITTLKKNVSNRTQPLPNSHGGKRLSQGTFLDDNESVDGFVVHFMAKEKDVEKLSLTILHTVPIIDYSYIFVIIVLCLLHFDKTHA